MALDTTRAIPSTDTLDVPLPADRSNFFRMFLNSEKLDDCEAIVCVAAADLQTAPEPTSRTAAAYARQRRLLGNVPLEKLYARAETLWSAAVINPFTLITAKKSPVRVVPIDIHSYIHNGMNREEAFPVSADVPAVPEEFSGTDDALDDLPPEAADAARHYAAVQRKSGSFQVWQTCWKLIIAYCLRWHRKALPMSVGTAIGIVLHMARVGYSYGYIRNVRWTISKAHRLARLPDPTCDDGFCMYLQIVARELGTESVNRKAPILFKELRAIGERALAKGTLKALQEWMAMCLQWFSTLRRENLAGLNIEDLRRTRDGYEVHIRRGKNHQTKPRDFWIGPIPGDPLVCPVANLDRWLDVLRETEGPLFRHLGLGGVLTKRRLSSKTLGNIIKRYMAEAGFAGENYATQSMRSGMITQALINGVNQATLRDLTGHERVESLDPYFIPGELAPNLSIAATYGTSYPPHGDLTTLSMAVTRRFTLPEVHYAAS